MVVVAIRGGCDGVEPFSGVVRPRSRSGFGRGRQGSRAVCSDATMVAEFEGFEADGGSATGGDDDRFGRFPAMFFGQKWVRWCRGCMEKLW